MLSIIQEQSLAYGQVCEDKVSGNGDSYRSKVLKITEACSTAVA